MRIIGGVAGGRRLAAPEGTATRPTSDRVREAIFNILGPPPEGARVLDLFAGSGALALEAISRGAVHATLVERAADPARLIAANAASLGFTAAVRIVRADVLATLPRLAATEAPFAWIFADPPYARVEEARGRLPRRGGSRGLAERGAEGPLITEDLAARALALLGEADAPLVAADGVVVVEHDRRLAPPEAAGSLARVDLRRYGDTEVSFYRSSR